MTTTPAAMLPSTLQKWRVTTGRTQEQAAQLIGVSLATYCRWEQGKAQPSRLAREKIERVLAEANKHQQ